MGSGTSFGRWRVAGSEVCPTRLAIHRRTAGCGVHIQMRRWFETQLRQGRLDNLTEMKICADAKDLQPSFSDLQNINIVQSLFTCLMELLNQRNLLGLSNLQSCWLEGLVPMEDAFRLLPGCLRELCLWADSPGYIILSSHLSRLSNLECLTLRMGGDHPDFGLQVDQALPSLRILRLVQGQLILSEDGPFPAALPQLTELVCDCDMRADYTACLRRELLWHVPYVRLVCMRATNSSELIVPADSRLEELDIHVPNGQKVNVIVHRPGVRIQIRG